jgi:hypothetical protein
MRQYGHHPDCRATQEGLALAARLAGAFVTAAPGEQFFHRLAEVARDALACHLAGPAGDNSPEPAPVVHAEQRLVGTAREAERAVPRSPPPSTGVIRMPALGLLNLKSIARWMDNGLSRSPPTDTSLRANLSGSRAFSRKIRSASDSIKARLRASASNTSVPAWYACSNSRANTGSLARHSATVLRAMPAARAASAIVSPAAIRIQDGLPFFQVSALSGLPRWAPYAAGPGSRYGQPEQPVVLTPAPSRRSPDAVAPEIRAAVLGASWCCRCSPVWPVRRSPPPS